MPRLQLDQALETHAEQTHHPAHPDPDNANRCRMEPDPSVRRECHRRADLEREIDPLVHDARLHELIAVHPDVKLFEGRAAIAEHMSIEQSAQAQGIYRDNRRMNVQNERLLDVECRDAPRRGGEKLSTQSLDAEDDPVVDVKVDSTHFGLYRHNGIARGSTFRRRGGRRRRSRGRALPVRRRGARVTSEEKRYERE